MPEARLTAMSTSINRGEPGQHFWNSGCIGTNLNGSKCTGKIIHKYIPYCENCRKNGDPSIAVVDHDRFGKCLVTKRDLPKNYRFALWGDVTRDKDMPDADREWGFETASGVFINPVPHKESSPIQYCQCPGPNEKVTVTFANPHLMLEDHDGKMITEKYGSMLFVTCLPVPKNHQLMMMYAENEKATERFFAERDIRRCDVHMDKYPTLLKKGKTVETLKLKPEDFGKRGRKAGSKTINMKKKPEPMANSNSASNSSSGAGKKNNSKSKKSGSSNSSNSSKSGAMKASSSTMKAQKGKASSNRIKGVMKNSSKKK